MEAGQKRPLEGSGGADAKKARLDEEALGGLAGGNMEDDFDALLAGGDLADFAAAPPEPPEEVARRSFVEKLGKGRVTEATLAELLSQLRDEAPKWGRIRQWRSTALLLVYAARSTRACRAAFVGLGLPLLGRLLQEAIGTLEQGQAIERQEAGMWALACLMCLRALPLGRATLWEHRVSIGKPFDRLHRWVGKEKSALAADLRKPTEMLCRRWRRQPKPVGQDHAPEHKALRSKVIEVISQGLQGVSGANSPASPAPVSMMSPGLPPPLAAAEVEMALFAKYGTPSAEYKQHARMLRSNFCLEGNADLRSRVLNGEITAEELVALDSAQLAPEAVREMRRAAARKSLCADIVRNLVPVVKEDGDRERGADFSATAPPVWVEAKEPALPRRDSSNISLPGDANDKPAEPAAGKKQEVSLPPPPVPPRTPAPLVPPPTPFQEGAAAAHEVEPPTPDVMATPQVDDEDEEEAALIRYLSNAA